MPDQLSARVPSDVLVRAASEAPRRASERSPRLREPPASVAASRQPTLDRATMAALAMRNARTCAVERGARPWGEVRAHYDVVGVDVATLRRMQTMRWSRVLRWGAILAACALTATVGLFFWENQRAYRRIEQRGTVVASPYGDIEYTQSGQGPDVLVVHGSGGGYDQGELMVQAVLSEDFHCITPSRFGYLRSTFHPGATFDQQAHAYAQLLDELGVERASVVALSHGGPSALLFAVLYPERVSSLTLISAGVASSNAAQQSDANDKGKALMTIFAHDWMYWGLTKAFRGQFMQLMGASDTVVAKLTDDQRRLADRFIDWMNPVLPRAAGAAFDNQAQMPNERVEAIRAPTLILHARDDGLQLFHNAEFAASHIPGARLVSFETGGHLLMITEQARVRSLTQEHIRLHAGPRLAR